MTAKASFIEAFCLGDTPLFRPLGCTVLVRLPDASDSWKTIYAALAKAGDTDCWAMAWRSDDVRYWWGKLNHHERLSLKRTPQWLKFHLDDCCATTRPVKR